MGRPVLAVNPVQTVNANQRVPDAGTNRGARQNLLVGENIVFSPAGQIQIGARVQKIETALR